MDNYFFSNVIYEIYVRSFKDSNDDGIGDIPGITSKLDYLKELGVNTIWLTPVFESPNFDFGYDVSDYYRINPEYGTVSDLIALLDEAHGRGIKVLLDLVLNHCSFRHPWFLDAIRNPNSRYKDYFILRDSIPNNLGCQFGTSAWHAAENGKYYLGLFSKYQPDFNWRNPELRKELLGIVEYYLKLGADGFRFDVLSLIQKPEKFEHVETDKEYADFKTYANYPGIGEYLEELSTLLNKYNAVSIGEGSGLSKEEGIEFGKYITYMLTFDLVNLDNSEVNKWNHDVFDLSKIKDTLELLQKLYNKTTPYVIFIENHDQPRIVSRIASPKYYAQAAKSIATLLYCLKGVPLLYQGQELGMTNINFRLEDVTDIEALNAYYLSANKEDMLTIINKKSRNHARTPMQWNLDVAAGFTNKVPWTKVNPNYKEINAELERQNTASVYEHYRNLLSIRKQMKGKTEFLNHSYPFVGYKRGSYLVVGNLSENMATPDMDFSNYEIVLNNETIFNKAFLPWQTILLKRRL